MRQAQEHRHTICIGRSHGIHAEPTTFGWKLAGWAFELDRDRTRLLRALEVNRVGQLSGTVGTYAGVEPEVERAACERLGLEPDPVSTQVIARDRHAELLSTLALVATSLDRFATEIRHLARTEVREVEEPFASGMKGSSAMPHKRNPKVAERISGLARVVRASALVGFENVPLWHERDISHSSAERVVIPDAFLALDYMLDRFTWIVEGLVVYPERMLRNLEASHGLVFSHRLLLALVEAGLGRGEAYRLVQRNAMQAWDEERDFRALVAADPEIAAHLDDGRSRRRVRPRGDRSPRGHRSSSASMRSRARRRPFMSDTAVHVGSGKVRELYALDEDRLLLVASDRISTFDVVLPTEIPDKGRVLTGLSAFWFAQTRDLVPNHLLALRSDGRSTECRRLEMLPIECVVRGYLSGSGWKDYLATGAVCGHRLAGGARRVGAASRADLHTCDEGPDRARREHRPRRGSRRSSARSGSTRSSGSRSSSTGTRRERAVGPRDHPRRHEARVRCRRRRAARPRRRGVHARFVAVLAGRRVRARRSAAVVRQAVRPRLLRVPRLGQDLPRPGAARRSSSPAPAGGTSRRSSG